MARTSGGAESGALGPDSAPSSPERHPDAHRAARSTGSTPHARDHAPRIPAGASDAPAPAADTLRQFDAHRPDSTLAPSTPTDPDLARVVGAWADLPPALRAGILAMIEAARLN
ncbi:MAG: hypothetical protein KF838_06010 [Phycisphaeraceae bacterium]|nr:MAG: hypothetical protein KF838_06010 [Phycisphaeraceae bacterium]